MSVFYVVLWKEAFTPKHLIFDLVSVPKSYKSEVGCFLTGSLNCIHSIFGLDVDFQVVLSYEEKWAGIFFKNAYLQSTNSSDSHLLLFRNATTI